MNKLVCIIFCFLLFGCAQQPKYYSSIQNIDLKKEYGITNVDLIYEDKEVKSSDLISIERSYSDKEVVIKKEGFKDYHLKLKSDWTDEKWATLKDTMIRDYDSDESAARLFIPLGTMESIIAIPAFGMGLLYLPWGIANDVYNIVIGAPSTLIINPWRKFEVEEKIILEPSDELRRTCNKKGYFISNSGCTKCDIPDKVVADDKETARCLSRFSDGVFSYSCTKQGMVKTSKEECNKCPNRHMVKDTCNFFTFK